MANEDGLVKPLHCDEESSDDWTFNLAKVPPPEKPYRPSLFIRILWFAVAAIVVVVALRTILWTLGYDFRVLGIGGGRRRTR